MTISGVDDNGNAGFGTVSFTLPARTVLEVSAQDLENGNVEKGLTGQLGNGAGKWRLTISSSEPSTVINILESAGGYISNLSGEAALLN